MTDRSAPTARPRRLQEPGKQPPASPSRGVATAKLRIDEIARLPKADTVVEGVRLAIAIASERRSAEAAHRAGTVLTRKNGSRGQSRWVGRPQNNGATPAGSFTTAVKAGLLLYEACTPTDRR